MSDGQVQTPTEEIDPTKYPTEAQLDGEFTRQMQQMGVLDYEQRTLWARQAEITARIDAIAEEKRKIDELVQKLQATKELVMRAAAEDSEQKVDPEGE